VTIREIYAEALKEKHYSLQLLIEFLVNEKQVLTMTDNEDKLTFYLQEKFRSKMNAHLLEYENQKKGSAS
jgi:translation initiation factor 2 beta subunit (eIF-2beta)/eIF-5